VLPLPPSFSGEWWKMVEEEFVSQRAIMVHFSAVASNARGALERFFQQRTKTNKQRSVFSEQERARAVDVQQERAGTILENKGACSRALASKSSEFYDRDLAPYFLPKIDFGE
jgi:hypothetical protein